MTAVTRNSRVCINGFQNVNIFVFFNLSETILVLQKVFTESDTKKRPQVTNKKKKKRLKTQSFKWKQEEKNIHFQCNGNYIQVHLLSSSGPAGHDAGWLLLPPARFGLASLFIAATSGSCCLLVTSQLGLINKLQSRLSLGTSSMLIWWTSYCPSSVTGTPCADDTNRLRRLRVYLAFSFVGAAGNQPQREILASCLMLSRQNELTEALRMLLQFISSRVSLFKAFQWQLLVFSPKVVPQTRGWTWKTKEWIGAEVGEERRERGGEWSLIPLQWQLNDLFHWEKSRLKKEKVRVRKERWRGVIVGWGVDSIRNRLLLFSPSGQPQAASLTVLKAAQTPLKLRHLKV